jgi:hypothetical protein
MTAQQPEVDGHVVRRIRGGVDLRSAVTWQVGLADSSSNHQSGMSAETSAGMRTAACLTKGAPGIAVRKA